MLEIAPELARAIRCVICDIDGVLTNGTFYLGEENREYRAYHYHDGIGLVLLQKAGLTVAAITTSRSPLVKQRLASLGIHEVYQGYLHKLVAYTDLTEKHGFADEEIAYIGDDLPDLPIIERCGLGIAVANAVAYVRSRARYVTRQTGGAGAVREVSEALLRARGSYQQVIDEYLHSLC